MTDLILDFNFEVVNFTIGETDEGLTEVSYDTVLDGVFLEPLTYSKSFTIDQSGDWKFEEPTQ